jgi:hypothetical protein
VPRKDTRVPSLICFYLFIYLFIYTSCPARRLVVSYIRGSNLVALYIFSGVSARRFEP